MKQDNKQNDKDLRQLESLLGKVVNYKPKEVPKKPARQPSKAELEEVYMFKGGKVELV